jgi:hypothetical protein
MEFWHWLIANKVVLIAGTLLVLKWIYNAWTPGVTFPQFVRQLIGEIVQESPSSFALSPAGLHLVAARRAAMSAVAEPLEQKGGGV